MDIEFNLKHPKETAEISPISKVFNAGSSVQMLDNRGSLNLISIIQNSENNKGPSKELKKGVSYSQAKKKKTTNSSRISEEKEIKPYKEKKRVVLKEQFIDYVDIESFKTHNIKMCFNELNLEPEEKQCKCFVL